MHLSKPLPVCISFLVLAAAASSSNLFPSGNVLQSHLLERGNLPGRLSHRLTAYKPFSGSPPASQLSPPSNQLALSVESIPPPVDPYSPLSDSWAVLPNPHSPTQPVFTKPHSLDRSPGKGTASLVERGRFFSCFKPGGCPSGKGSRSSLAVHPESPLQCGPAKQKDCDQVCRCNATGNIICDVLPRDNVRKYEKADKHYEYLRLMKRVCRYTCQCANASSRDLHPGPPSSRGSSPGQPDRDTIPDAPRTPLLVERGAMQSCTENPEKCRPNTRSRASSQSRPLPDSAPADKALLSPFPTEHVPTVTSRGLPIECGGPDKNNCKSHRYCVGSRYMSCDKQSKSDYERLLQTPAYPKPWKAEEAVKKQVAKIRRESRRYLEKPV